MPISSPRSILAFKQSYAFVIGINNYTTLKPLKTAVQDARAVAMRLKVLQGFDHVLLLSDIDKKQLRALLSWLEQKAHQESIYSLPEALFNAQGRESPIGWLRTAEELAEGVEKKQLYPGEDEGNNGEFTDLWLVREAQLDITPEKDSVVFYYAGHGLEDRVDDGPTGFLAPADCTYAPSTQIPMADVYFALSGLNCLHTLLILDCCFAGKFRYSTMRGDEEPYLVPIHERRLKRYQSSNAWQVLVSAGPDQKANDSARWADLRDHSPFAKTFIQALEGRADLSISKNRGRKGDGLITATELFLYVWEEVERLTGDHKPQHPGIFKMRQHREGEFIFINPSQPFQPAPDPEINPYLGLKAYNADHTDLLFGRKRVIQEMVDKIKGSPVLLITGPSGSGKSSAVKAGLIPGLENEKYKIVRPAEVLLSNNLKSDLQSEKLDVLLIDQLEETFSHPDSNEIQQQILSLQKVIMERAERHREKLAVTLLDRLEKAKVLFLKGPKGSGKSRLVRDHVLPLLEKKGYQKHDLLPREWLKESAGKHRFEKFLENIGRKGPQVLFIDQYEDLFHYPAKNAFELTLERLIKEREDSDLLLILAVRTESEPLIARSPLGKFWKWDKLFSVPVHQPLLLFTMRSDFEWQLKKSLLKDLWELPHLYRISAMNQAELREAITGPAFWAMYDFKDRDEPGEEGGIDIGEEVVNRIVEELADAPGALPLLSFTMYSFFEIAKTRNRRLLLDDYLHELKGVAGALSKKVDEAYLRMSAEEQAVMKKVFLRMVNVNDGEFSRRKVIHSSFFGLTDRAGRPVLSELEFEIEDKPIVDKVIDLLGDSGAQLLVQNNNERGEPYIEPIHDALINYWERCREWIDEFGKDRLMLQRELWKAVKENHAGGPGKNVPGYSVPAASEEEAKIASGNVSELWESNPRLFQVLDQLTTAAQPKFLDESDPLLNKILKGIPASDHENFISVWHECKSKKIFPSFNSLIVTGYSDKVLDILLSEVDHWLNFHEKDFIRKSWAKRTEEVMELIRERDEARANLYATYAIQEKQKGNFDLGMRLAMKAWKMAPVPKSPIIYEGFMNGWFAEKRPCTVLIADLDQHEHVVFSAIFSPDGTRIVTASADKTAKIWDLEGHILANLDQHTDAVHSAIFSPDGTKVLTASADKTAKIWDLEGHILASLDQHTDAIHSAVFSLDGTRVMTASADKTAKIWDLEGNVLLNLDQHEGPVVSAVFLPDGNKVMTASRDNAVKIWDLEGHVLVNLEQEHILFAVLSPDGTKVVIASNNFTAYLWSLDGTFLARMDHEHIIRSVVFSPDGTKILTANVDGVAKIWDLKGHIIVKLEYPDEFNSAVFSPDGTKVLIALSGATAKIWDIDGKLLANLDRHERTVNSAVFSPDGTKIATTSFDKTSKLWTIKRNIVATLDQHKGGVDLAIFSPDSTKIVTAAKYSHTKMWDLEGHILANLDQHRDRVWSIAFSPDGTKVLTASGDNSATADNTALIWDLEGNVLVDFVYHQFAVRSAVFSPDGTKVLTASLDKTAKIWDLEGNVLANLSRHEGSVLSAIFSPGGTKIVTASTDKTAKIWDLEGHLLSNLDKHMGTVNSAIFSPDGTKVVTASEDGTAKVWNMGGDLLVNLDKHKGAVNSAIFSPDGTKIATASRDATAKIWDLNGQVLANLDKHVDVVNSVVFSSDGTMVVTVSWDKTAKIWDLEGRVLANLDKHDGAVNSAVFSSDGTRIVTASEDTTAKIWPLPVLIQQWIDELGTITFTKREKTTFGIK